MFTIQGLEFAIFLSKTEVQRLDADRGKKNQIVYPSVPAGFDVD